MADTVKLPFANDGSFMAMFLASQGASGDDDQTDKVEAAAEPSGGTEGGSSSSTAEAATAAAAGEFVPRPCLACSQPIAT
mmetsp:Transcript_125268/g.187097  ORF Transcript_125268/g.187097 Transcript_125268/m.187097 type:complete len:80 (+) Transcript_125268:3-242(+)